jgi:hypothetical protein
MNKGVISKSIMWLAWLFAALLSILIAHRS